MTAELASPLKRRRVSACDRDARPVTTHTPPAVTINSFPISSSPTPWSYHGHLIAAPMVRMSTLPFRLLCRHYGASIVYSEELIAAKLKLCRRSIHPVTSTIDFHSPNSSGSVLSTYPGEPLVVQLGANDPSEALQAALVVAADADVRAIDLNMGCPERFSLQGGMGSALLKQPQLVHSILSTLRRNLPSTVAVTCKIRLLPSLHDTIQLMHTCQSAGIDAIALHARQVPDRPRHRALVDDVPLLASHLSIPCVFNGDLFTREDLVRWKGLGSSLMLARGAQWNPSIFSEQPLPVFDIVRQFLSVARVYAPSVGNGKWSVMEQLKGHVGGLQTYRHIIQAKSWDDLEHGLDLVREEVEAAVAAGVPEGAQPAMRERKSREVERLRRLVHGPYEPPAVAWEERPQRKEAPPVEEEKAQTPTPTIANIEPG